MKYKRMRPKEGVDEVDYLVNHHLVVLWEEDDAPVPDKEQTHAAFKRITGLNTDSYHKREDYGDHFIDVYYPSGWVKCSSYDGGFVGVLIKET